MIIKRCLRGYDEMSPTKTGWTGKTPILREALFKLPGKYVSQKFGKRMRALQSQIQHVVFLLSISNRLCSPSS
jgi:hypothetical protein